MRARCSPQGDGGGRRVRAFAIRRRRGPSPCACRSCRGVSPGRSFAVFSSGVSARRIPCTYCRSSARRDGRVDCRSSPRLAKGLFSCSTSCWWNLRFLRTQETSRARARASARGCTLSSRWASGRPSAISSAQDAITGTTSRSYADAFFEAHGEDELHLFTGAVERSFSDVSYADECYLVFGRESRGLDPAVIEAHREHCVRIPMRADERSLNLSNAVAIASYEALRQLGYPQLV